MFGLPSRRADRRLSNNSLPTATSSFKKLLDWENPGMRTERPKREISQSRRMPRQQNMTSSSPWHHVNICEHPPGFPMISVDQEAMKSMMNRMNRISRNRWCRSNFLSTCSYSATPKQRPPESPEQWPPTGEPVH